MLAALIAGSLALTGCTHWWGGSTTSGPDMHRSMLGFVAGKDYTRSQLFTVGTNGRALRQLTHGRFVTDATWNPAGNEVVYTRALINPTAGIRVVVRGYEVLVLRIGGEPRVIRRCSANCDPGSFAWSPDGRRIAFVTNIPSTHTGTAAEIAVMNTDGRGFQAICNEQTCGQGLADPQWSPDGRRLLFSNAGTINFIGIGVLPSRVWATSEGLGAPVQITQPGCHPGTPKLKGCAYDAWARWSPDGRWIAFSRYTTHVHPGRFKARTWIEVMRADGSDLQGVAQCAGILCNQDMTPSWSPDGTRIAYVPRAERSPWINLVTVGAPTAPFVQIKTCNGQVCVTPQGGLEWSPNGSSIAFLSEGRSPRLYTIGAGRSSLHLVADDGQCCLAWLR